MALADRYGQNWCCIWDISKRVW